MARGLKTGRRTKGVPNRKGSKAERYWHDIVVGTPAEKKALTHSQRQEKKMTVKEYFVAAFELCQQDPELNLMAFAKNYPTAFYAMATKLIPQEIQQSVSADIQITWKEELSFEPNSAVKIDDKNYLDFSENNSY